MSHENLKIYIDFLNGFSCETYVSQTKLDIKARGLELSAEDFDKLNLLAEKGLLKVEQNKEKHFDKAMVNFERVLQLMPHNTAIRMDFVQMVKKKYEEEEVARLFKSLVNQVNVLKRLPLDDAQTKELKSLQKYINKKNKRKIGYAFLWYFLGIIALALGGTLGYDYYKNWKSKEIRLEYQREIEKRIQDQQAVEDTPIEEELELDTTNERWDNFATFVVDNSRMTAHKGTTSYNLQGSVVLKDSIVSADLNMIAKSFDGEVLASNSLELNQTDTPLPANTAIPLQQSLSVLFSQDVIGNVELTPTNIVFSEDGADILDLPLIAQEKTSYEDRLEFRAFNQSLYTGFDKRYYVYRFFIKNNSDKTISNLKVEAILRNDDQTVEIINDNRIVVAGGPLMHSQQQWLQTLIMSNALNSPVLDQLVFKPIELINEQAIPDEN